MEKRQYKTYGNVAYSQQPQKQPKPKKAPSSNPANFTRAKAPLREKEELPPFTAIGFLASCLLAALLITSYAYLTTTSDQVVQLRSLLGGLESQKSILNAQYEKLFDIERIEEAIGTQLIRPTNNQVIYIDLSQPDSFTMYDQEKGGLSFLTTLKNILSEFFA